MADDKMVELMMLMLNKSLIPEIDPSCDAKAQLHACTQARTKDVADRIDKVNARETSAAAYGCRGGVGSVRFFKGKREIRRPFLGYSSRAEIYMNIRLYVEAGDSIGASRRGLRWT